MDFIEELTWRGMLQEMVPGTKEWLKDTPRKGYIGFDPTADSLHIGSLSQIITLMHFQRHGHIPVVLIGGATGMIGDPTGKKQERPLLTEDEIRHNAECIRKQLEKFIDFDQGKAMMVNNYDWFKDMRLIDFIRDIGKHITINYMISKESVKTRMEYGLSFTEFTYQLIQGFDFLYLSRHYDCYMQMGGSDQWGNITTGLELIRRLDQKDAYALVTHLITKSDGNKFGKTEQGNVWLDRTKTSPYKFYQFWINLSDEDAAKMIKIFTLLPQEEISHLIDEHFQSPEKRILQKKLAEEITCLVHSKEDFLEARQASEILFGKEPIEALQKMNDQLIEEIFEGIPVFEVPLNELENVIPAPDFLAVYTKIFSSKGEARRMLQSGAVSVNKQKITPETTFDTRMLLKNKYILIQKGKKNYFLVKVH